MGVGTRAGVKAQINAVQVIEKSEGYSGGSDEDYGFEEEEGFSYSAPTAETPKETPNEFSETPEDEDFADDEDF